MKPSLSLPHAGREMANEISTWPHPAFGRDGRRVFGLRNDDDGVMPLFYRQRLHEREALQGIAATSTRGGDWL